MAEVSPPTSEADTTPASADESRRLRALRVRLLILVVGIAVPLLALALGAVWQTTASERRRMEGRLVDQARAIAGAVDVEMDRAGLYLRALASSPSLAAEDWRALHGQALQSAPRGTFVAVLDGEGRRLLNTFFPLDGGGLTPVETSAAPTVRKALESGEVVFSGIVDRTAMGGPAVVAMLGGDTASGRRVAVMLVMPSQLLSGLLGQQNLPSDWLSAVLDQNDIVIARSRDPDRFVGTTAVAPVRQALAARSSGLIHTRTVENLTATLAFARAPISGYAAVIAVPEVVFGRVFFSALRPVALIGGLLVLAALVIAMLASRRILSAVRRGYAEEKSLREEVARSLRIRDAELKESERRFQTIADAMPQLVWSTLPDGYHDYFNERWYEFTGTAPGSTMGGIWNDLLHPDDQERAAKRWAQSLETGEPYEIEYRFKSADGGYRWFIGRAVPMRDATGRIERWFGTCTDIHDKKLVEEALVSTQRQLKARVAELAQEKARLERLMLSAPNLIYINDLQRRRNAYVNPQIFESLGYGPSELMGRPLKTLGAFVHPDDRRRVAEFASQVRRIADGEVREIEYRIRHTDGSYRWFLVRETPFQRDPVGKVIQVLGTALDIGSRKQAEERQQMLIRELHHRVKNILATVQAIASATGRSSTSFSAFRERFSDRLVSLGRTHSLLTREAWAGAGIRDILESELSPYLQDGESRVVIDGPALVVPRDMTVPIGMAIHELTTNAVKYGALSVPEGRVHVTIASDGAVPEPRMTLEWRESGGPPVKVPERSGFGSLLLNRLLASQLGGEVAIDYRPDGVVARIDVVLRKDDVR
ncbi:sensor histidine kinase [Phreatobacter cathodiphilus]|uniref:sensor histidine kinase n=1 Tax=Phreatobacter cathodiphilus TaxID=1868589 RepID=UPI0011B239E5|nr:PAS domain-containing protein [Phreatobacter cathodiphilus]